MDLKNAKPENFMYDIDSDWTGEVSDYWKKIYAKVDKMLAKEKTSANAKGNEVGVVFRSK